MAYFLSPIGNTQTIDANGDPLVGGTIETYLAGTSTARTTYTDDTGGTSQGVVMTLNSLGYPTNGPVWLLGGVPLKFIIKNAAGVTQSTFDDISGIGDTSSVTDEWQLYGAAPTYISATSFSVVGDQTNTFQVNRRLKSANTGGTVHSTIATSPFGAGITTVTVTNTSGVLDSGLSAVSYGLLAALNPSVPAIYAKSGANSDITSLTGLTTPLTRAQGGTGVAASRTLVQRVSTFTGAVATGTTVIPVDDTIPQNTEGDQYMTQAITPTNTANILVVEVFFNGSSSVGNYVAVALFRDSTAGAVAAAAMAPGAATLGNLKFNYEVVAGSVSATTFKVRAGPSGAATVTFNGASGARLFGGVLPSAIVISEYTP